MSWTNRPRTPRTRPSASAAISIDQILVAFLRRVGEMFAPVLDPFHRTMQQGRRGNGRDIFRINAKLRAETAADIGRRNPQPAFVEIDIVGKRIAQIVRLLGRGPNLRLTIGDLHIQAAAFHRMRGAAMDPEILVQHMSGFRERRLGIAKADFVCDDFV